MFVSIAYDPRVDCSSSPKSTYVLYCGHHTVKICRQLRKENICYHRRPVIAEDSRRRKILQDLGRKGNMHFSQGIAI
jgi:hypothetical protein